MAGRVLYTLILLFPPLVLPYYIGFAQSSVAPQVIQVDRTTWHQCHRLPSTRELLLGVSLYNTPSQIYFPDGIQFYVDPPGQCAGEPELIISFSKRAGVYFVDLAEMGLTKVFSSWRYYDLQANPLHLAAHNPRAGRKGYAKGSIQDMAFGKRRTVRGWYEVKKLKDVPNSVSSTASGPNGGTPQYKADYIERHGLPATGTGSDKEKEKKVIAWMKEQLNKWSKSPVDGDSPEDGEEGITLPQSEQVEIQIAQEDLDIPAPGRAAAFKDNIPAPLNEEVIGARPIRNIQTSRDIIGQSKKTTTLPVVQRMQEILKESARGKVKIPPPENGFGLGSLKMGSTIPELIEQIGILTLDEKSSNTALGWALVKLATLRDKALVRKEGSVVDNFQVVVDNIKAVAAREAEERRQMKVSALLDFSYLSEIDEATDFKISEDTIIPLPPIARNLRLGGGESIVPPKQGPINTEPIYVDSDDEEPIEPYGRRRQTQSGVPITHFIRNEVAREMEEEEQEEEVIEIKSDDTDDERAMREGVLESGPETENQQAWEASLREVDLENIEDLGELPAVGTSSDWIENLIDMDFEYPDGW
ncbi:hypothetical protein TWF718_000212 [Orbilia javanica]|uniref:Uncharacterized protein n=1 Tax=Orbilia javanica TaxID=47235 RepID=A0AAN8RRF3_9PEZI